MPAGSLETRLQRTPLRQRLTATLAVLLALFVANAVIVVVASRARDASRAAVETRLNPAQVDVERVLTTLVNQNSGELGYRLTLDDSFLAVYRKGVTQETRTVAALRRDLAGHRSALQAVDAVEDSARTWRAHVLQDIAADLSGDRAPGTSTASALQSKALFDRVRGAVAQLASVVDSLQRGAERAQGVDDAWLLRSVVSVLVTAILVVVAGFLVLRRSLTRPLEDLVGEIEGVGRGELDRPVEARGPREFVQVGAAVEAMRVRMLEDAGETLNRSLILATEEQRRRLAADIHDDPTQALTAVTLRLQRLRRRLSGEDAVMLADAERAASAALGRLRDLIFELQSPLLDTEGLVAAVRVYLEETFDPDEVEWQVHGSDDGDLPPSIRALAYRLTRSALHNVAKHAQARAVSVTFSHGDRRLEVCVADDGRGFDPARAEVPEPGHLGLIASEEFVRAAGGAFSVESAPGSGTTVRFWLPAA